MVENRPSFNVHVIPADVPDVEEAAQAIGPLLGQASTEGAARIRAGRAQPYEPVLLAREVDERTMVAMEERKIDLPGVSLRVHPIRSYLDGDSAAQFLGYVSEVSQEQLHREEDRDFQPGEMVGQAGVEQVFDAFVRGINGREEIEVDARGRLGPLGDRPAPPPGV